jgi:lipopolysaccharide biosynthesis glycosyltransferase
MIPIISGYDTDIFSLAQHFTIATYFRFFVPDILTRYNKVVFLDCDMAVLRDVADLYKMELDGYYIAAAHDVDISMRVANAKHENWVRYYHEVLKLQDVNDYFQAGCLLMNLELMRKNNITEQLLMELMRIKNPRYSDQCVLNAVCKGYVKRLPLKWNYTWHLVLCNDIGRITEVWRNEYIEAGKDPYIIHFSGTGTKPWLNPSFNGAYIFWKYARLTPFYERLLSNITTSSLSNLARHIERLLGVALEYKKIKWKYFIHKLASRITFGKAYKRHREKAKSLKSILRSFQHNTIEKL